MNGTFLLENDYEPELGKFFIEITITLVFWDIKMGNVTLSSSNDGQDNQLNICRFSEICLS